MPDARRILVIKLRAIGDVLLSTIVLRNLRLAFPQAEIHVLTEPPSAVFVRRLPDVQEVLVYDRKRMSGLDLIRAVRAGGYDTVLDLFGNPRTALLTRLSGAHTRVGYRFRGRTYAYSVLVTPRGGEVHNTEFNLDALRALGVAIQDRNLYFPLAPEDHQAADRILGADGDAPWVALNVGGGWYTKRWPAASFARLGDALHEQEGVRMLLPWGPGEEEAVRATAAAMRTPALIPPATSLTELGALLRRMRLVITNDSGPMHIAAAVGARVLGIYGPTRPELQGPYGSGHRTIRREGLSCLGCNLTSCPIGHPCMLGLEADTVLATARAMLSPTGNHP